jgi:6-phosphofructokinase 1
MTDRVIGSAFGVAAVDLIAEEKYDRMVIWHNREVDSVPIAEAIAQYRAVDPNEILVKTARSMGIYLGE